MSYEAFVGWIKENMFWVIAACALLLIMLQKKIRDKLKERKLSKKKEPQFKGPSSGGPFGVESQSQFRNKSAHPDLKSVTMLDSYKKQLEGDIKNLCEQLRNLDIDAARFNSEYTQKMNNMNKKYADINNRRQKLILMLKAVDIDGQ